MDLIDWNFEIETLHEIEDIYDYNVDIYVILSDGSKYVATFFTLQNVKTIMNRHKKSGESKGGIYFWAADSIIVESLNPLLIKSTIADLLDKRGFDSIFLKVEEENL